MAELRIEIDASLYARLSQMAKDQGKTESELVVEHIVQWLKPQPVARDKGMWKAYISLRMKGLEPEDIVEQLDCSEEDLSRWDQEIRTDPGRWNEAYFLIRKATDPLTWEMRVRDRFVAYWGEKPGKTGT